MKHCEMIRVVKFVDMFMGNKRAYIYKIRCGFFVDVEFTWTNCCQFSLLDAEVDG